MNNASQNISSYNNDLLNRFLWNIDNDISLDFLSNELTGIDKQ